MRWWLRNRAVWVPVAAILLSCAGCTLFNDTRLPLPSIIGQLGYEAPMFFFLAMVPVLALSWSLARRVGPAESVSPRRTALLDLALALCLIAITLGWDALFGAQAMALARNVTIGLSSVLVLARFIPAALSGLPFVAATLITGVTGRGPDQELHHWAVLAQPTSSVAALVLTVVALAAAVVVSGLEPVGRSVRAPAGD